MRRVHVPQVAAGQVRLPADQSHHLRDVLRLGKGDAVELFDAAGRIGRGTIVQTSPDVMVAIDAVEQAEPTARVVVASAVPKGDRADWMIEKLSELGVATFVPLRTTRSVVHPEGTSKLDRWRRIAVESAKQCKRVGVMEIAPLASLEAVVRDTRPADGIFFSTAGAAPLQQAMNPTRRAATLFIGPEGGWTESEERAMRDAGLTPASLGPTILRVETAAVLSAGLTLLLSQTDHP